jgi:TonB family protein
MGSTSGKPRRRARLSYWLLLAAVIHGELLLVVGTVVYFQAPRDAELAAAMKEAAKQGAEPEAVEITAVDDETARRILADLEVAEEKAKEEEAKKEIEATEAPGQVVELAKPQEEKRPETARFAAEYDSTVEKETRKHGKLDEKARQGATAGEADETKPAAPAQPPSPAGQSGALALRAPGPPGPQKGPSPTPTPEVQSQAPGPGDEPNPADAPDPEGIRTPGGKLALRPPPELGGGGENGTPPTRAPGVSSLLPSEQQIARAVGSGTEDHLRDIDDGNETALNAKKWKFASFFNRVKEQVREHWKPAETYQRRDPSGKVYGSQDRYTLLRVQLKPDGSLANVALEQPSGIEFLDDEAIEAFKQAQPFPNPPRQLVEANSGLIHFRFGFYFELSGSPKMKIFRYNSM